MGGPTVIAWGSEELKQRFLRGIATNEEIWCQLFSEPGAGSDVAGLATRAERDGDEWVVNGQKVWTTLAHLAALRDAAGAHRSRPAEAPGPQLLRRRHARSRASRCGRCVQITGDAEFNEVFFNDARVPDAWRLGPVGDGWRVAITTLMNERVSLSGAGLGRAATPSAAARSQRLIDRSARCTIRTCGSASRRRGSTAGSSRSTTSAPPTSVGAAPRSGPRARSRSCSRRCSTSGCRELRRRPRRCRRCRVGGRGASTAERDAQLRRRRERRPAHRGARVPALAGQHHRGRDVGRSCATSSASACSGSRRIPTSRATCRGRTSRARSDRSGLAGGAFGRQRPAQQIGVDRAVDARVLGVRGVLGAVEREQSRAVEPGHQVLGAGERGRRIARRARRPGSAPRRRRGRRPAAR